MKQVFALVVTSFVIAGCAFPVISTDVTGGAGRKERRTGTNFQGPNDLARNWQDTNVKYFGREEFDRMLSGQPFGDLPKPCFSGTLCGLGNNARPKAGLQS